MKVRSVVTGAVLGLSISFVEALAGTAVVIQPVGATGPHTIIGSDIFLPTANQRVRLELRIAGWGDEQLKTAQVTINSSGFDNGSVPLQHAVVPCPGNNSTGHAFCAQNLEAGSKCSVDCASGSCSCESGFININRTDFAGWGIDDISAANISGPDYSMGLVVIPPEYVIDPGTSLYVGTFFLTVPDGAQGIYRVPVKVSDTFFQYPSPTGDTRITPTLNMAARIIIGDPVPPGIRYVAYQPGQAGTQTAVRVILDSIYHPGPPTAVGEDRDFGALEGFYRWAGPPQTFPDNAPGSIFRAAPLQCEPYFTDWGALGTVYLYGDAIVPSSQYVVRQVPISCQDDPDNPACFGPPQYVHTGQWGDAAPPYARSDQPAQPDVVDMAEMLDAFRGLLDASPKFLTHLRGAVPDPTQSISFLDVRFLADAIRGLPFPYPVPAPCP